MTTTFPAVETFEKMKGKEIPFEDLPSSVARKFAWSVTGVDPNTKQAFTAKAIAKQVRSHKTKAYRFRDGSFGLATESYHDSFVCGKDSSDYLSVGQNDQLRTHGWKSKREREEEAAEEAAAELERIEAEDESTLAHVRSAVEGEGFHYAFCHYSDFKSVKDKKFHDLRKAYLKAAEALSKHIGDPETF